MTNLTILACICGLHTLPTILDHDLIQGEPPAPTDTRQVFSPSDYTGTDWQRVQQAAWDADDVDGAVVLDRVYEVEHAVNVSGPMMLTGGGLRRACTPDVVVTDFAPAGATCVDTSGAGLAYSETVLLTTGPAWADSIETATVWSAMPGEVCFFGPLVSDIGAGTRLVRVHPLLRLTPPVIDGAVVESTLLDGANRCANYTHDWRYNSTAQLRGSNIIRDVVVYDSPGESFTTCGSRVEGVHAFDLQGSLVHKSCGAWPAPVDILVGNFVDGANLATDAVMQHSEGLFTSSANAGAVFSANNLFLHGGENVFGLSNETGEDIVSSGDCYVDFRAVIGLLPDADPERFYFSAGMHNVSTVIE